ncbi:odorant receptor 22c isoform X1 [Harpegnathos saltator]|uniref:odorant receptor 22c isoform X1 n=1 Tax=Harpegnathos saltator TaxID=610380 RepID=UPI000DBEDBFC|nr:odorant receptor 22c isoform X1 [Harpegnathos saltator]
MDFESANPFNVRVNKISGNLLPMTADGSSFPILWKIYSCLIWLLELTQMIILIPGCMLVPKEKALKDGLIGVAVTLEVAFVVARIHMRRGLVQRMIQKLNEILCLDDEMMRYIVTTNLRSMEIPLKIYWSAGIMSVVLWSGTSLLMIFKRNSFSYVDYRMPISYGKEPISTGTFVIGSLIIMFSNMLIFTKKVAVDSYTIHLTLLITSQYRYIASKLSVIFRDKASRNDSNDSTGNKNYSTSDLSAKKEIKAVCRHHNAIVHVMSMLKELLSLNFNFLYVNSVFRFCFIGIMVLAIPSTNLLEGYLILTYASGGVVELYILCSCVQQLLDAAAEITNKAFHQEWYLHESSVKRTFMSLIMANKLDCKLATFEKFNLSLPSLMSILNQSYSVALLILRTN